MSEYIIRVDENDERWHYVGQQYTHFFGYPITDEIVRCRDCKHYELSRWYESAIFPPMGTDIEHVCAFFADGVKVEPDGFCAWGKRRES